MNDKVELPVTTRYRSHTGYMGLDEADQYLVNVQAEVVGACIGLEDDEPDGEINLGHLAFKLIRVGAAMENHMSHLELFDETQELTNLSAAVFATGYEDYVPELTKAFPEANTYGDLMLIEHIGLRPHARGMRLGLAVIYKAIQDWSGGCSLVAINPYPLQHEQDEYDGEEAWADLDLKQFTDSFGDSRQRLVSYFGQLGFKDAGDSAYIFYDTGMRHPIAADLDLPETIHVDRQHFIESSGDF